jgi:hypothetical protein
VCEQSTTARHHASFLHKPVQRQHVPLITMHGDAVSRQAREFILEHRNRDYELPRLIYIQCQFWHAFRPLTGSSFTKWPIEWP